VGYTGAANFHGTPGIPADRHKVYGTLATRLVDPNPQFKGLYVIIDDQEDQNFKNAQKLANALPAGTILKFARDLKPLQVKIVVQRAMQQGISN
jgi:hypothetical protein